MRKIISAVLLIAMLAGVAMFAFAPEGAANTVTLKAGTAKMKITPADPNGRVLVMGYPAKGVMHDIYARVLTLHDGDKRMVIVTYDLNCLDVATPILRSRCLHELGIDPSLLILLGTHNHAAPIQIVPDNFDYGRILADNIFNLIKQAIADEQGPARVYFGAGEGRWLFSVGGHKVDPEIQLLKVTAGGKVKALFFNQASHPMQASFWRVEPGHPGYAVESIEKRMPGTQAMYGDACGGNQFPLVGSIMLAPLPIAKMQGRLLADAAIRISRKNLTDVTGPISAKLEVISLPLAPPISLEEAETLAKNEKVDMTLGFVPYPHPQREYNWIRNLIRHYKENIPFPTRTDERVCTDDGFILRELPEPREFPCRYEETIVARLGPMVFVAMQGEVCAPIGKRIKATFKGEFPLFVTAYMGEHNLYIPTRKLVEQDAYQAQVIRIQYASPVGWSPNVEDEMVAGVVKMVKEAAAK